jgi:MerR family copper efflux transcriptional regulator
MAERAMRERAMRGARVTDEPGRRGMLKIGDVSRFSGIGIEALRFYERGGLLDRPSRTESGYRAYGPEVLDRLAFIKRAQVLGFSLDEIKKIITDARAGRSPCDEVREIVRLRLSELDERMREMLRYRKELAATLEEWDERGRAPGHICGLIESAEIEHSIKQPRRVERKRKKG